MFVQYKSYLSAVIQHLVLTELIDDNFVHQINYCAVYLLINNDDIRQMSNFERLKNRSPSLSQDGLKVYTSNKQI